MKEKIYDARTGMEYVLVGDYYLPALKLPRTRPIGRWGMLHKAYLKLRKPAYYQSLLLSGKLDYYIDKSGLIGELISRTGTKVTLITRPRRFGKTLGMSMLESFFDIRKDSRKLFEGLEITKNQALCDEWMNQYPTIFVSFRQVDGLNFTGGI